MWKSPGAAVAIDPSQVVPGLYVWLNVRWDEHPFISNRLMVKHAKDVAVIQSLDVRGRLFYFPAKSTAEPGAYVPTTAEVAAQQAAQEAALKAELLAEIKRLDDAKREKRLRQRDAAARADRAWEDGARKTREALQTLHRSPKAAGAMLQDLSRETAASISQGKEVLLHLLGDKKEAGAAVPRAQCTHAVHAHGQKGGADRARTLRSGHGRLGA
ncbi:MAG: DUF3391 domain-containing protein [Acidovorax sp.]|nr:DUF3391 domain-containing protein [Acidovorax sp.]